MIKFYEDVKAGVEQAMKECELSIGMTLKEAVEKQTPIKPTNHGGRVFYCPICNKNLGNKGPNYCQRCGQRIGWTV